MATVTRENIGNLHDKLTVKLTKEDYIPGFEKALKSYSKNANIPGFRKGMVPAGMIKKMYGASIFVDEVLRNAGSELDKYLQDQKLEIFAQPLGMESATQQNLDMNNPADFEFAFEVGLKPEFTIDPLNGSHKLDKYKVTVTDAMIDEEIEKISIKAGNMTHPDTITSEDNVINVVFEESDAEGNIVEGGIRKENSLLVKYFSAALQAQLMGKKAEDSIVFQVASSFDEKLLPAIIRDLEMDPQDPAAKEKYFKMNIAQVGMIERAPLDEKLFTDVYPNQDITTEEAFRNKLREEIGNYWDIQSKNRLHNEIFETLVHETNIDLPVEFLKRWMQKGGEKERTFEEVEAEFSSFDHQLRWTLISDKLIRENGIEVSMDELKDFARQQIMGYYGVQNGDDAAWLNPVVDNMMKDEKYLDNTYRQLITDKLLTWCESKFQLNEKEVALDEFINLPQSHHHHH